MSPVFGHGQLRLYLLSLLADGPRHGYDVIRDLEDRSQGLYSPSAGTVYPRLAKLEEEGLVERADEGRKAMYRITAAGLREVQPPGRPGRPGGGPGRLPARARRRPQAPGAQLR
ncbi:MAG: PadR family transcriptional regulator [Actinomycetota bacterium]|nr:PadR family transcriptional regulator [Actinomycetota bacterium]